ncbi:mtDNA inheritance, partitioning of the mitochondrial organelle [Apophysomyces sp. BC1034]|nr:mtDNA inheritance, partitioning of the mitochondrial organelle [Apophysomyces sp. BC1034]
MMTGVETYTPRVLIYDRKGGFGSLQKYNQLFGDETSEDPLSWDQGVSNSVGALPTHPYQQQLDRPPGDAMDVDAADQLDETVEVWSDFNRIFYHPRSINPINTHPINGIARFDAYPAGCEAFRDNEKEMDTFDENFRFFAEECDQLQGFQVLTGVDDAYGGFGAGLLDAIRSEFPKTPIITYGLSDRHEDHETRRTINRAMGLTTLSDQSSLYVPLYTPQSLNPNQHLIHPNYSLPYHTSAILSAAIETASLPYRLKKKAWSMADMIGQLNWQGSTKLAMLSSSFPLPFSANGYEPGFELSLYNLSTLTQQPSETVFGESVVARGIPTSARGDRAAYFERLFSGFNDESSPCHQRSIVDISYPLAHSYPRFFSSLLNDQGLISQQKQIIAPVQVPMLTHLFTGSALHESLEKEVWKLGKVQSKDLVEFNYGDFGLTREDFLETKENLISLSDAYRTDDDMM